MLTKAYECLTDEKTKQTCLKYNNPDGPGSMKVGIALPTWLLKKENRTAFLAVVFIVLLFVIPVIIMNIWSNLTEYDDFGIMKQNYSRYQDELNENSLVCKIIECVCKTMEIF